MLLIQYFGVSYLYFQFICLLAFGNRFQGVIITIVLISFIAYRIYRPKRIVDKEMKSDKFNINNTNTFIFYDKNLEVQNNNGSFTYRYFMFHKIFETEDFFYLYVTKENAFLVAKDSFTYGTKENFSNFIKNKCKLRYKYKNG